MLTEGSQTSRSADIEIEIVYALADRQVVVQRRVGPGTRARDAVVSSGLEEQFADLDLANVPLGVWGKQVADDFLLAAGDRVELYRFLESDPRERRRALAASGDTMRA